MQSWGAYYIILVSSRLLPENRQLINRRFVRSILLVLFPLINRRLLTRASWNLKPALNSYRFFILVSMVAWNLGRWHCLLGPCSKRRPWGISPIRLRTSLVLHYAQKLFWRLGSLKLAKPLHDRLFDWCFAALQSCTCDCVLASVLPGSDSWHFLAWAEAVYEVRTSESSRGV